MASEKIYRITDPSRRLLAEPGYSDDLIDYLAPLAASWMLLAIVTAVAALASFAIVKFQFTKWYQAIAIIKPMTPQQTAGHMQGLLDGANLGMLRHFVGSEYNSDAAEEYITILTSYSFVTAMVEQHHLADEIAPRGATPLSSDTRNWAVYRAMLSRLKCEYSVKNSSITLTFEDPSRERAQRILSYEIDDLREMLRSREVRNASDAVASLSSQVKKVSDTLLSKEIYDLIATQVQRQELAQIEADFAFVVLQSLVASDLPVWPRVMIDTFAAGLAALILASTIVLLVDGLRYVRRPASISSIRS
ncbi:MAG TPA: Wzz/FepE/Etk N-terminal domain-containing protein [Candidatus Binataceae bacterium]|nr:Wzz/FepE/Etk N-terminal domain-containing protein [Candidatus Binataceae bacterium]